MATETALKTHCPNCGAKLHRPDLSLCAYCATPLSIGAAQQVDAATIARLQRMREHKSFAAAMSFVPPDQVVERQAGRLLTRGTLALAAGLALGLAGFLLRDGAAFLPLVVLGGALALAGSWALLRPAALRAAHRAAPLLRRPALVAERRSTTALEGAVDYYFTLRFDDGSEGEFHWPGQGTMYEPLSNGYTGIAYTRGDRLIDFRRLT
ncbi:MAG: hypothetical protein RL112_2013 [Planctomycetota bacterium]|jgi:hypothetical protein